MLAQPGAIMFLLVIMPLVILRLGAILLEGYAIWFLTVGGMEEFLSDRVII